MVLSGKLGLVNMFMCDCSVFIVAYNCVVVLAHDLQRILHYLWFPRSANGLVMNMQREFI